MVDEESKFPTDKTDMTIATVSSRVQSSALARGSRKQRY